MRTLAKLVMLLAVLAICMPAYGQGEIDILIYAKTMDCWEAWWDGDWDTDEDKITGFLVLEVLYDPETGEIQDILDAEQIEYWKDGRNKWYWQIEEEFLIERVEVDGEVIWVIEYILAEDDDEAQILMVRGVPKDMNIGLGRDAEDKREVARILKGYSLYLYISEGVEKEMCTITWRLQQRWTRLANHEDECDGDFECAIFDIVKAWLEDRGYDEVD